MAPLHPDTNAKPPWRPWARKPSFTSPPPSGDTLLKITVPATQACLDFLDYIKLLCDSGFPRVFFPVRNILPFTLERLAHLEFLSLLKCPLLKKTFSDCHISVSLCLPHGLAQAPIPCEFLTVKFLMARLQCTIIFKFQFKIIGIFYLSPGEHKLNESRDSGVSSLGFHWELSLASGTWRISPQFLDHTKPDTEYLLHFGGELQRWESFNQHTQSIPLLKSSRQTIQTAW